MSETVWVAERVAVYGQGVVAVLTSREAAERFAATVRPDADGHHNWRFTELRLGFVPAAEPPPEDRRQSWNRLTAPGFAERRPEDEWIPLPPAPVVSSTPREASE